MRLSEENQERMGYIVLWIVLSLALLGSVVGIAVKILTVADALGG